MNRSYTQVAMFWSYTNAVMDLEQAKGCYGVIISIAQIGAITGATLARHSSYFGIPQLILLGSVIVLSVSLLVKLYHIIYIHSGTSHHHRHQLQSHPSTESTEGVVPRVTAEWLPPHTAVSSYTWLYLHAFYQFISGFYEGLLLIWRHNYVIKLLLLSCLYEIVVTVLDFEFKLRSALQVAVQSDMTMDHNKTGTEDIFVSLMGQFGQLTNGISLIVSMFLFSFIVKTIGVRMTLMVFPSILFASVIFTNLTSSLTLLFIVVSVLKSLVFSLHEPLKELLYIPTSQPIKFKAKAWIDVFGSRLFKALGSLITYNSYGSVKTLKSISELPNIVLSIALLVVAYTVGVEFEKHIRRQHIIGSENEITDKKTSASSSSADSGTAGGLHQSPRVTAADARSGQSTPRVRFDAFVFEYALDEDDYDADTT